jgi:glycosyltransferase involved in cell wall biosynthesis
MAATDRPVRLLAPVVHELGRYPNLRFRLEQWVPYLRRDHGIEVEFLPFESPELSLLMRQRGNRGRKLALTLRDTVRRWAQRHDARRFDGAIVVHEASTLGAPWFERYLAEHGIPFVYDFDDPLWVTSVEFGDWVTRLWRGPKKFEEITRLASQVSVGNDFLASWACQFNPHVSIVRTSIDLATYHVPAERKRHEPFTIEWSGQAGASMRFLDSVRPALEELGRSMPIKLRVISTERPEPYENVQLEFVHWRAETEAPDLADADVGIMPLPDVDSTRGKCGLKALQYMAVGVPAVVSPVGINAEIVRNGENGLLATTHEDWVRQLKRLATDEPLRQRFASAARRTVEEHYTAEHSARDFAAAVREMLGRSGRS